MNATLNALLISTAGTVTRVEITDDNDRGFLGEVYQLLVCDRVEAVTIDRSLTAWVDEEGLYQQAPNPLASALFSVFYRCEAAAHLHGPVLLTGGIAEDGTETSLDASTAEHIVALARFAVTARNGGAA